MLWLSCFWLASVSCERPAEADEYGPDLPGQFLSGRMPASPLPDVTGVPGWAESDYVTDPADGNKRNVTGDIRPEHLDTAFSYIGVRDDGDNYGPEVERFLATSGLGGGYPWCAAFVAYVMEVTVRPVAFPTVRSALATDYITARSIKASRVLMGVDRPPEGAVVIWRRGNGIFGHAGLVDRWEDDCGETVEGNTSAPAGSGNEDVEAERDGGGVWAKRRCIEPGNFFRIVSFTEVIYKEN